MTLSKDGSLFPDVEELLHIPMGTEHGRDRCPLSWRHYDLPYPRSWVPSWAEVQEAHDRWWRVYELAVRHPVNATLRLDAEQRFRYYRRLVDLWSGEDRDVQPREEEVVAEVTVRDVDEWQAWQERNRQRRRAHWKAIGLPASFWS